MNQGQSALTTDPGLLRAQTHHLHSHLPRSSLFSQFFSYIPPQIGSAPFSRSASIFLYLFPQLLRPLSPALCQPLSWSCSALLHASLTPERGQFCAVLCNIPGNAAYLASLASLASLPPPKPLVHFPSHSGHVVRFCHTSCSTVCENALSRLIG